MTFISTDELRPVNGNRSGVLTSSSSSVGGSKWHVALFATFEFGWDNFTFKGRNWAVKALERVRNTSVTMLCEVGEALGTADLSSGGDVMLVHLLAKEVVSHASSAVGELGWAVLDSGTDAVLEVG